MISGKGFREVVCESGTGSTLDWPVYGGEGERGVN